MHPIGDTTLVKVGAKRKCKNKIVVGGSLIQRDYEFLSSPLPRRVKEWILFGVSSPLVIWKARIQTLNCIPSFEHAMRKHVDGTILRHFTKV